MVLGQIWVGSLLPSVAPAAPWAQHNKGAYLVTHTPLISPYQLLLFSQTTTAITKTSTKHPSHRRMPVNVVQHFRRVKSLNQPSANPFCSFGVKEMPVNVVQQWRRVEAAGPMLRPALDSLNQLGEVPWRVDAAVLDLQLQVFRSGGNKKLDIPPPPSALDPTAFPPAESKPAAFRRRLAVSRARAEMYSLWCDALYKLSLANHYRDDIFWLPHNLDFRGRVYACPPHLSQLGADSARALLKFANKRPLGPHGLKWLKLHAINLTGTMKKKTVEER
ncbi:unnamed protein product [Plutella xylostella]|uniref:(diamondback moth) hypothetical protein n=1 Tax=Plutella xylostella TaxID=51655 RepID=A0A8S4E936_PLUXY|nr:unnamed protein product [Plutella xylostella]